MNELRVDREKCTKCGTCVRICPAGIVRFGSDGFPEIAENQSIRCMECSQCVLFCPHYADTLSFMDSAKIVKCADLKLPDAESAENFLKSRRSIRKFKQEAIPHETFLRIFETVKQAPTAVNRQPVRWIVTEDPEKTKEIANLVLCYFREEIFKNPTSPVS
ncbi:MAG: nitroreductase family protein, partial [Synergistes sp.]|nr:nitroreductase family protein [Synergistes sp.]